MAKIFSPVPNSVQVIDIDGVQWIDVSAQGDEEIQWLKQTFAFHALDLQEVIQNPQRTQFHNSEDYLFLAMSFPMPDPLHSRMSGREVDIFLGRDYILTIHDNSFPVLKEVAHEFGSLDTAVLAEDSISPAYIFYRILKRAYASSLQKCDVFSADIRAIEKKLFTSHEQIILKDILLVKQNISEIRYILQSHKNALRKFIASSPLFYGDGMVNVYFQSLVEDVKEIWDTLESLNHAISAIHDTHVSLQSFTLNKTMKTLTTIYVMLCPAALIIGLFSMNVLLPSALKGITFWDVIGIASLVEILLLLILRWKKIL